MEIRKNGEIIFYDNYYGTLSLYEVTMMAPSYRGSTTGADLDQNTRPMG